ncbi:MAG: anthranilate phosphoribosyltransferase [Planctomycetes bacterium]|nr:anthranilate phosphoribosyltransferase [Planctomycetota bacterium]
MTVNSRQILDRVNAGGHLSQAETADVIDSIMRGQWQPEAIGALLLGLRQNGETAEEVTGAAEAMRRHMTPLESRFRNLVDTCGTGGDGSATFNISTAAALVTAAAGQPVAKHGNRRVTSRSGSADVLQQLGLNIEAGVAEVEGLLNELGICFCFAPLYHGAMKQVGAVRQSLGVPTIFNILGPLANPARAPFQVVGVGREALRPLVAHALRKLGTQRSLVVRGEDGLDEVTCSGTTRVSDVTPEGIKEFVWQPADFGLTASPLDALRVDGPEASAAMIDRVLRGERGAPRDVVVLNSAAALWVTGAERSLPAAAERAAAAIDTGAAHALLTRLANRSHGR